MKTFQLFLLTVLAYSTAAIIVEVRLNSYSNPSSRDCDGDTCDIIDTVCDNIFQFCLRAVGSGVCLTNRITTDEISEDTLSFSASQLSDLAISNPLRFSVSDIPTSIELELFVEVTDADTLFPDPVDTFTIPFDRQQTTFGSPISRSGSCGRGASISVSIRITCNSGFQAPDCTTCAPNYYPANTCTVFCEPQNDALASYSCNPVTGVRECARNYYPQGNCETFCLARNDTVASYTCNPITGIRECAQNYYPQGICEMFCLARNDSSGHFRCDPETGDKKCLPGYTDPTTDCTESSTSEGGRSEPSPFVGSLLFIVGVVIAVVVIVLAFFILCCILCVIGALSSNCSCPKLDCSCPTIDCSCPTIDCSCPTLDCSCPTLDCSCPTCPTINCDPCNWSDFCKWLTCGFKLDDANPCILCIVCILVFLASPLVILLLVAVGPVFLVGSCLLYCLLHVCES